MSKKSDGSLIFRALILMIFGSCGSYTVLAATGVPHWVVKLVTLLVFALTGFLFVLTIRKKS